MKTNLSHESQKIVRTLILTNLCKKYEKLVSAKSELTWSCFCAGNDRLVSVIVSTNFSRLKFCSDKLARLITLTNLCEIRQKTVSTNFRLVRSNFSRQTEKLRQTITRRYFCCTCEKIAAIKFEIRLSNLIKLLEKIVSSITRSIFRRCEEKISRVVTLANYSLSCLKLVQTINWLKLSPNWHKIVDSIRPVSLSR